MIRRAHHVEIGRARLSVVAGLTPIATGLLHYPGVRCPSCGGRAFEIGRSTAECVRCGGALLLTNSDPLRDAKGPSK